MSIYHGEQDRIWMQQVRKRINSLFVHTDLEGLMRINWLLDQEEIREFNRKNLWQTLKFFSEYKAPLEQQLQNSRTEEELKNYADYMIELTREPVYNEAFWKAMRRLSGEFQDRSAENASSPDDLFSRLHLHRLSDLNVVQVSGIMGLARAWALIPEQCQTQMVDLALRSLTNPAITTGTHHVAAAVGASINGNLVGATLGAIWLGYAIFRSLFKWYRGQITGRRCCKDIIDSLVSLAGGAAGGAIGATVGSCAAGPVGALVGGLVGGVLGSHWASLLSDRLTQKLFGIPKEVALENAYRFFGVDIAASNEEITAAYHRLCLKCHPDKGGSSEDFVEVQVHMGVIKVARGDYDNILSEAPTAAQIEAY